MKASVGGLAAAAVALLFVLAHGLGGDDVLLTLELDSSLQGNGEIFYASRGEPFTPRRSVPFNVPADDGWQRLSVRLPGTARIQRIRIDPGTSRGRFSIGTLTLEAPRINRRLGPRDLQRMGGPVVQAELESVDALGMMFASTGSDPSLEVVLDDTLSTSPGRMKTLWLLLLAAAAGYLGWISLAAAGRWMSGRASPMLDRIGHGLSDRRLLVFDRGVVASFVAIFASALLYVCLNLNQSSAGVWESVFPNAPTRQAIDFGTAKRIRSDEWTVQTPWALNQVLAGYPRHNPNIGGESAPILAAMPLDGVLALPQAKFWGFHLLPLDRGFSWWWAYKSFGLVASMLWMLLLLTRGNLAASWLGSLWIYGSSFTQWWFSSSLPEIAIAFALAVVGAIYALHSGRRTLVVVGCALVLYACTNLVLHLYPPAIVPLGYLGALLVLGHAVSTDGNAPFRNLLAFRAVSAGIAALLLAAFLFHYYSAAEASIRAVMATVYPGKRISIGGQFPVEKLASGFFEAFRIGETRLPLKPTNASEASSFLFLAPLAMLVVSLRALLSRRNAHLLALLAFLVVCLCWVSIRLPAPMESLLQAMGWQYVTSKRAVFTLGIGSIIASTLVLDIAMRRPSDLYAAGTRNSTAVLVCVSLIALGWWMSVLDPTFFTAGTIALGLLSSALIVWGISHGWPAVVALGLATYMMATMTVNPLVSGLSSMTSKPILVAARMHSTPGHRWLVVGEPFFTQGLKGLGLDAFGGYIYQPDMAAVEILDPMHQYAQSWNRYARVRVASDPSAVAPVFTTTWGDQYTVTMDVCGPHTHGLGITHVAYTSPVPPPDLACLQEIPAPADSGVRLFRYLTTP